MISFLKLPARLSFPSNVRTYAIHKRHFPRPTSKRPERPPPKIKDPLTAPNAARHSIGPNLTFIYRPPPTAPSPFSLTTAPASPLLIPGKPLSTAAAEESQAVGPSSLPPPLLNKSKVSERNLTTEQIEKMKDLRIKNPGHWTQSRLAKRFGCSMRFVSIAAPLSKDLQRQALANRDQKHEEKRSKWGERKATAVVIRQKRRSLW